MTTAVRPMLPADREVLFGILDSIPEFTPDEVLVAREVIDDYLRDGPRSGYNILLVEDGGSIAGYVCYGPTPMTLGTWDLYWIAVSPEKQGLGIGSQLVTLVEKKIDESGGRLITVETSSKKTYQKTRQFYLHHGYQIVGRLPDFYAPEDDKLILQKRLEAQLRSARHPAFARRQPHLHRPLAHS